jgi:hypothetical protein
MTLELFLKTLITKLETSDIQFSILRNYETLPTVLEKGDIDFLISKEHIENIDEIIRSISDIYVIGVTKRQYVHNYFIYNIDKGGNSRAIQIDFVFQFIYKGVNYLDISSLLNNSRTMLNKQFYIPSQFDEIFLVFFPFYLATGSINKKYEDSIISTFKETEKEFKASCKKLDFDATLTEIFYNSILNQNDILLKKIVTKIRYKILFQNFSIVDIILHYFREITLRIPFKNSYSIKVKLMHDNIKELNKSLDSFSKTNLFININNIFDYLKLFKIQNNFTMYIFYKNENNVTIAETLNELISYMPLQDESDKL